MNESFEILLERFLPYVANSKTLDLVSTKFGILIVENAGHRSVDIYVDLLDSFEDLAGRLFRELEGDVSESHGWRDMTDEDAEELRSRAEPYISGLPNEADARTLLENYIAWMLSLSNKRQDD